MSAGRVAAERSGNVVWLRMLGQGKANAMSPSMWEGLKHGLEAAQNNRRVRLIAITGTDRYFSSGQDLTALAGRGAKELKNTLFAKLVKPAFDAILESRLPVLAAVNGPAVGVGAEIVMACDLAIAERDSFFQLPQARLGLAPAITLGLNQPFRGHKRMMELLLTGRRVNAQEALSMGLISGISEGDLAERVVQQADQIARVPELAVRKTKDFLRKSKRTSLYDSVFRELTMSLRGPETSKRINGFLRQRNG